MAPEKQLLLVDVAAEVTADYQENIGINSTIRGSALIVSA
jgi:hypothetical protein